MLSISKEQMDLLKEQFMQAKVDALRKEYVSAFRTAGEEDAALAARFDDACARARALGCDTEWSCWNFVLLDRRFGPGFEDRPPCAALLHGSGSGHERMRALMRPNSGVW